MCQLSYILYLLVDTLLYWIFLYENVILHASELQLKTYIEQARALLSHLLKGY